MEIAFESQKLRRVCESERAANKALGEECARLLRHRLADLWAAKSVASLTADDLCAITADDSEAMAIQLGARSSLVFVSNHTTAPTTKDGRLDLRRVQRIRIVSLGGGA